MVLCCGTCGSALLHNLLHALAWSWYAGVLGLQRTDKVRRVQFGT
jgi:hypothetical protein